VNQTTTTLVRENPLLFANSTWNPYLCLSWVDARLPSSPAVWKVKARLLGTIDWEKELIQLLSKLEKESI